MLSPHSQHVLLEVTVFAHIQSLLLIHTFTVIDQLLIHKPDLAILSNYPNRVLSCKDTLGLQLNWERPRVPGVEHSVEENAVAFGPEYQGVRGNFEVNNAFIFIVLIVGFGEPFENVVAHNKAVFPCPKHSPVVDSPRVYAAVIEKHHDEIINSCHFDHPGMPLLAQLSDLSKLCRLINIFLELTNKMHES